MFDNIGGKLKITAKLFMAVGTLGSIAAAIYLTVKEMVQIWCAVALVIGVPLICWFLAALLYGFGELIEKMTEIAANTRGTNVPLSDKTAAVQTNLRQKRDTLEAWYAEGLITEEEYRKKRTEISG